MGKEFALQISSKRFTNQSIDLCSSGVRLLTIDSGDGKADYCWVGPNGELIVYINVFGEGSATFVPYNNGNPIASSVGGSRDEIRLADIK